VFIDSRGIKLGRGGGETGTGEARLVTIVVREEAPCLDEKGTLRQLKVLRGGRGGEERGRPGEDYIFRRMRVSKTREKGLNNPKRRDCSPKRIRRGRGGEVKYVF